MPPWILVCPSSRGIGLELARRLIRTTELPVVATARKNIDQTKEAILKSEDGNSQEKIDESRLEVVQLDVCDESTIEAAASHCRFKFQSDQKSSNGSSGDSSHLHLAFCIPGVLYPEKSPQQIDATNAMHSFQINTIGPMLMMKHFAPFLPRKATTMPDASQTGPLPASHATWVNMSARVGSITDNDLGGWFSYRASKAAVNQVTRTFDNLLKTNSGGKAIAVGMHPGTVQTGLSKGFWESVPEGKLFSTGYAAERLVEVVGGLDAKEQRGRCWDWKGEEVPP